MPRLMPAALVAALLAGPALAAEDRPAAVAACEAAALAEMQARHPDAAEVQALEDEIAVTETPGGQTEVRGGGQLAEEVGAWTPFAYTCAYSPTTEQVTRVELR